MDYLTRRLLAPSALFLLQVPGSLQAQGDGPDRPDYSAAECPACAEWNAPTPPTQLFGNVYYVGPRGLSAILVTSPAGHVLLDGGLPESAVPGDKGYSGTDGVQQMAEDEPLYAAR